MTDAIDECPPVVAADGIVLEAVLSLADEPVAAAIVTHPHPLMGGDMHNPVTAGLARGLSNVGISALRANFRGTGASEGVHDEGRAEQLDVTAMIDAVAAACPGLPLVGVGYSFGADVLLAVHDARLAGIVAVTPPLRVVAADELASPRGSCPTLVLSAEHDQFRDAEAAARITGGWPDTQVEPIPGADHFLAGSIRTVVDRVATFVATLSG